MRYITKFLTWAILAFVLDIVVAMVVDPSVGGDFFCVHISLITFYMVAKPLGVWLRSRHG